MTYKTRSMLNIGAALALSLLVGLLLHQWMQRVRSVQPVAAPHEAQRVEAPKPAKIVVAASALPRGAKLSEQVLRIAEFEAGKLPEGYLTDLAALDGAIAAVPIGEGEPVTKDKTAALGMGDLVSQGKRAIAVQASKVFGLSGTIRPGSMVDVLVTLSDPQDNKKTITKLVLADIPVLAADVEKEPAPKGGQKASTNSSAIYTLELTPEESEKLAQATTQGTIHFALRNPADNGPVATRGADYERMISSYRISEQRGKASAPARRKPATVVETLRGTDKTQVNF